MATRQNYPPRQNNQHIDLKLLAKFLIGAAVLVCLVVLGNQLSGWVSGLFDFRITPANESQLHWLLMSSMFAYTVLMTIPFVPGAEIGLTVLMVIGPKIAPLVYFCTLIALLLSFLIGRYIPEQVLINLFHRLGLTRAETLLLELKGLDSRERLQMIVSRSPKKLTPFLLKYRYIALLLAINMPGNIVIGGGGGIAMVAGLSRLFSLPFYLLTIALAVAPFPLILTLFGEYLGNWSLK